MGSGFNLQHLSGHKSTLADSMEHAEKKDQ